MSRTKLRRRRHIAEAAARLFADRGFDAVTIADIAAEAGVAKMTVTNHFPRKEDLFLDRLDEQIDELRTALRECGATAPVNIVRDYELGLLDSGDPLAGLTRTPHFWRILNSSSSLLVRLREHFHSLGRTVTDQLMANGWTPASARLEGELIGAAMSHVHFEALSRFRSGHITDDAVAEQRATILATFHRLSETGRLVGQQPSTV